VIKKFQALAAALLSGLPEDGSINAITMISTDKSSDKEMVQYKMVAAFNEGEMEVAMTVTKIAIPPVSTSQATTAPTA
jgi:hypothetical protein